MLIGIYRGEEHTVILLHPNAGRDMLLGFTRLHSSHAWQETCSDLIVADWEGHKPNPACWSTVAQPLFL